MSGSRLSPRAASTLTLGATVLATLTFSSIAFAASPVMTVKGGKGFDDATAAAPVGGNPATTVGAQRLYVFQKAADAWASKLDSAVPIVIQADFSALGCSGGGAILGHAGATYSIPLDVTGLPAKTYFPLPLARHLAGKADLSNMITGVDASVPDIKASFNTDLGKSGCGVKAFYYGLDGQSGDQPDLYGTVLHELAHGLGFSSDVDGDTGGISGGGPLDIFSRHVWDIGVDMSWATMTNAQRKTSYLNVRKLVWDGENVRRQAREVLSPGVATLTFNPPVNGFSGNLSEAEFGDWSIGTWTAPLVTLSECVRAPAGSLSGKIALVVTDVCPGIQSAATAQAAGARAVIVVDFDDQLPPDTARASPDLMAQLPVRIPVVSISFDDAQVLANAVAGGATMVTLTRDPNRLVGADSKGRTHLFATNPEQSGSSISHWDVLTRPDLVQEPVAPSITPTDLSMELALFRDLGWRTLCGNGQMDTGEDCDEGNHNGDGTVTCSSRCSKLVSTPTGGTGMGGSSATGGSGLGGMATSSGGVGTGGLATGGVGTAGSGSGGAEATGGAPGPTGGQIGTGGNVELPPTGRAQNIVGGCGCVLNGDDEGSLSMTLVLGVAVVLSRRRRPSGN